LLLLLGLSIVFWAAGPLAGSLSGFTRASVPASALMAVCPAIAAVLVARHAGDLGNLGKLVARCPRPDRSWLVAVFGMPAVIGIAAVLTGQTAGFALPGWDALALALAYTVAAVAEESGWTAFVLPRLLPAVGELPAGLAIGAVWGLWHVIPYVQAGHTAWWIAGQCVYTVVFRVLLVRLALSQRGSMWPAVAAHAGYNLAWSLSPGAGAHYDPWVAAAVTALLVAVTRAATQLPATDHYEAEMMTGTATKQAPGEG
jgi:membrane protease YdiL (CAAX protease family)